MKPGPAKKVGKKSDPSKAALKQVIAETVSVEVDAQVPDHATYKVLVNGAKVYSSYLMLSSLAQNSNKFYIVQILEKNGKLFQWTRYGRVGYKGQTLIKDCADVTKDFDSVLKAKKQKKYNEIKMALGKDKTESTGFFSNVWNTISNTVKSLYSSATLQSEF